MRPLFRASADLFRTEDEIVAKIDLPGVSREDIDVVLENDTLHISVAKEGERESRTGTAYFMERSFSGYYRSISLPEDADQENLRADYRDGVLTVRMPTMARGRGGGREYEEELPPAEGGGGYYSQMGEGQRGREPASPPHPGSLSGQSRGGGRQRVQVGQEEGQARGEGYLSQMGGGERTGREPASPAHPGSFVGESQRRVPSEPSLPKRRRRRVEVR